MANEFKIKQGLILGGPSSQPVISIQNSSTSIISDASSILVTGKAIYDFSDANFGYKNEIDSSFLLYATNTSIGLAEFAKNSSFGLYATNASVNSALLPYATNSSVNSALLPYATNASIGLAEFAKNSSLALYVQKAGDTMTGDLTINSSLFVNGNIGIRLDDPSTLPVKALDIAGDINFNQVTPPVYSSLVLTQDSSDTYNLAAATYYYAVSFYTATGEAFSEAAGKSVVLDASSRVLISAIPTSTDKRVIGRRLWRTPKNGNSSLTQYLAQISDNVTTTYTDNTPDSSLGSITTYSYGNYRRDNTTTKGLYVNNFIYGKFGTWNLGLGPISLSNLTTGTENIAIGVGSGALTNLRFATGNIGIGSSAMYVLKTGNNNIGIGGTVLYNVDSGSYNTALGGALTLRSSDVATINGNTGIGHTALYMCASSNNYNIGLGYYAGAGYRGNFNTFIGCMPYRSIPGYTVGDYNIVLGYDSFSNASTGADNNILIGKQLQLQSPAGDNQLSIGNLIFGTNLNGTGLTISTGNIGIREPDPIAVLDISGNVNIDGSLNIRNQRILGVANPIDSSDAVNKYYVDSSFGLKIWTVDLSTVSLIDTGQDLQLSSIQMQENGREMVLVDMSVTSTEPSGTIENYSFNMDGCTALRIEGVANASSGVSQSYIVATVNYFYMGEPSADNSWRWYINPSTDLVYEKRVAGTWTYAGKFSV